MTNRSEYNDFRLVELYDLQNRWAADDEFFLALANERPASHIADVGCGTGRLTVTLAQAGHVVTGIDPALASLQVAQQKPHAEHVKWLHGTAADLPDKAFDLILMTSHVSQVFLSDDEWLETLQHVRRALPKGGRLAFDMRDPVLRGWENWDSGDERETVRLSNGEQLETWTTVDEIDTQRGLVTFTENTLFTATDEIISDKATLRFQNEGELRKSLGEAGFSDVQIFGGWQREKVGEGRGELVVVAE